MDRTTKEVKRVIIKRVNSELDVSINQDTGGLRIRANADDPEHTGRLVVIPIAPNIVKVEMEQVQVQVQVPDFVAPGIDRTLLESNNFMQAIRALGYDRYRIDDHESGGSICRLWRVGDSVAAISIVGGDPLHAAHSALGAARFLNETR